MSPVSTEQLLNEYTVYGCHGTSFRQHAKKSEYYLQLFSSPARGQIYKIIILSRVSFYLPRNSLVVFTYSSSRTLRIIKESVMGMDHRAERQRSSLESKEMSPNREGSANYTMSPSGLCWGINPKEKE